MRLLHPTRFLKFSLACVDETGMSEFSCPSDMPTELAVVPMRESVVFPHMVLPASALGEAAAHPALNESEWVLLVAQRNPRATAPEVGDLYSVGTLAWVVRSGTELSGPRRREENLHVSGSSDPLAPDSQSERRQVGFSQHGVSTRSEQH